MRPTRPSPQDVLRTLQRFDPAIHAKVVSRQTDRTAFSPRRAAIAAARALGHSFPRIGDAFDRDHSSVHSACKSYMAEQTSSGPRAEAEAILFRYLIAGANQRASIRGIAS